MKKIRRFSSYIIPHKGDFFLTLLFNGLYALFTALSFASLIPMLSIIFNETKQILEKPIFPGIVNFNKNYLDDLLNFFVTKNTIENGIDSTLSYMIIGILLIFLLKNIFAYLSNLYTMFLKNSLVRDLSDEMFKKVISLPVSFYSKRKKGDILSRITSDIYTINQSYLNLMVSFIREPLNIIFTLIFMLKINWKLTLFLSIFIPISGYLISIITKNIKNHSIAIFQKRGNILSKVEEAIASLRIIKAFNAETFVIEKYKTLNHQIFKLSNTLEKRMAASTPTSEFLGIISIACLLWFGGRMVLIEGSIPSSVFITFMALAYNILTPAKALSKANNAIKIGHSAADRIFEILDSPNPIMDEKNSIEIRGFEKEIIFEKVYFKYDTKYILKNFSLTIPKGKTIAIVGKSGSGKSTLINLITRFWDVDKGTIRIDGIDIRKIQIQSLRNQMGIVTQEALMFNDTIRNNITLSNPDSDPNDTEHNMKISARIANADAFIEDLPHQYNTFIGDRGDMLSGGQKQKIAIARAVFKNPSIIILDEATSALDSISEKSVQQALENVMKNKTSIVIAHRLSTVQNADMIVILKKGKISEQGSHENLMKLKKIYHSLVKMQSLEK